MKKLFAILAAALLLNVAAAAEFPSDGEVIVVVDGQVVGVGEFDEGDLELKLVEGFEGSAEMSVVDDDGNQYTVEVTVTGDGVVLLDDTLEDLVEVVEGEGGEAEITVHEELEVSVDNAFGAGVPDHVDLPDVAKVGMERAAENHEEAKERAEENRAEAGASVDGRVDGEVGGEVGDDDDDEEDQDDEDDDEDDDAEAGASVGVGVGVGNRD